MAPLHLSSLHLLPTTPPRPPPGSLHSQRFLHWLACSPATPPPFSLPSGLQPLPDSPAPPPPPFSLPRGLQPLPNPPVPPPPPRSLPSSLQPLPDPPVPPYRLAPQQTPPSPATSLLKDLVQLVEACL
ncbi:hypothetical protein PCANC_27142 [Puccinia coronata f. sp. avenae]|uniref:Uncharacterized protein n=1 Tax=Puccinia coronata f. sp. avenae TaxID=200324 RepID=A0A2N5S2W9_9BASI|nr:hypothetical protein PCANC_27142 [Puccinia coronata f. sp. avenae]